MKDNPSSSDFKEHLVVSEDAIAACVDAITQANKTKEPVRIVGGGTKLGRLANKSEFNNLSLAEHSGVVNYQPSELFVTVLCGTTVNQLNTFLRANQQRLACDIPEIAGSTIGGVVASAAAGPASEVRGKVRDALLGVCMVNGLGKCLSFGGELIKNVAGFDVSRLNSGAYGRLGALVTVTFRVDSIQDKIVNLSRRECKAAEALDIIRSLTQYSKAVVAASWHNQRVILRLEGSSKLVESFGYVEDNWEVETKKTDPWKELVAGDFSKLIDNHCLVIRMRCQADLPIDCLPDALPFSIDCCGTVRWYQIESKHHLFLLSRGVFARLAQQGIQLVRYVQPYMFQSNLVPLPSSLAKLHQRVMQAFDPKGLCNPDLQWYGL